MVDPSEPAASPVHGDGAKTVDFIEPGLIGYLVGEPIGKEVAGISIFIIF